MSPHSLDRRAGDSNVAGWGSFVILKRAQILLLPKIIPVQTPLYTLTAEDCVSNRRPSRLRRLQ
jgi:hypothetical protein